MLLALGNQGSRWKRTPIQHLIRQKPLSQNTDNLIQFTPVKCKTRHVGSVGAIKTEKPFTLLHLRSWRLLLRLVRDSTMADISPYIYTHTQHETNIYIYYQIKSSTSKYRGKDPRHLHHRVSAKTLECRSNLHDRFSSAHVHAPFPFSMLHKSVP